MPTPSFFQLFRRSKYRKCDDADVSPQSVNRRELFAVASLAFALKHDSDFMSEFLREICEEKNRPAEDFRIDCEAAHCADLCLISNDEATVYVIEAKVDAGLDPNQDPWHPDFESGYAKAISENFLGAQKISYILLQRTRNTQDKKPVRNLTCWQKTWLDLIPSQESALVSDLFDSLADLEVSSFKMRNFRNKIMSPKTKDAAEMFTFCTGLAEHLGIPENQIPFDIATQPHTWFGFNLTPKCNLEKLRNSLPYERLGWVGFEEIEETHTITPALWFYSDTEDEQRRVKKLVHGYKIGIEHGFSFSVIPEAPVSCEKEWFLELFRKLGGKC